MLRNYLRMWLGVEENTNDIKYENSKVNKALDQSNENRNLIRGLQKQISRLDNKVKKH